MRLTMAVAMLAAAVFAAGVASADGEKTSPPRKATGKGPAKPADDDPAASRDAKFRSWDKDGNGTLSRGEYPGHPGNFRALDRDSDGALSKEEFQHRAGGSAPPEAETEEFAAKDHDRNGTLSRSEWPDSFEFDRRDHNRDGAVTRDEYFSPRAPSGRDEEFRRFDTDNDGVITRAEWRGRSSIFATLDTDGNGALSRDEYARWGRSRLPR